MLNKPFGFVSAVVVVALLISWFAFWETPFLLVTLASVLALCIILSRRKTKAANAGIISLVIAFLISIAPLHSHFAAREEANAAAIQAAAVARQAEIAHANHERNLAWQRTHPAEYARQRAKARADALRLEQRHIAAQRAAIAAQRVAVAKARKAEARSEADAKADATNTPEPQQTDSIDYSPTADTPVVTANGVNCFASSEIAAKWFDDIASGDSEAAGSLVNDTGGYTIDAGTHGMVTASTFKTMHFEITSGPHQGDECWLVMGGTEGVGDFGAAFRD